jgi:hypothetical protein
MIYLLTDEVTNSFQHSSWEADSYWAAIFYGTWQITTEAYPVQVIFSPNTNTVF